MDVKETDDNSDVAAPSSSTTNSKDKQKHRGRKRKRSSSSSESENDLILPDNTFETERNVHASAVRNNLDDISVRKILKKVVTNDHVLALVKLREEEEGDSESDDKNVQPKLTRSKAKELKRASPRSAPWNLQNLELTPINQIHVKTRPEVKALIAQELPDDEDDEEYEPTQDDVPSDDDHDHSCSDLDSQPRTPATPASQCTPSPKVLKDGPFKLPQEVSSSARRKLNVDEEEATIALRTRSKLSLSTTTIEHIESAFVPPDDVQPPVDNLWNQFLSDCMAPAPPHDDDDDADPDPEYNAAADADALDEDEDILASSLIKISKKELNDLVTELFNVMPPADADEDLTLEKLANSVLTDTSQTEVPRWEGKTEPLSDDEGTIKPSMRLAFEKGNNITTSSGKKETEDVPTPSTQATNHVPCERIEPMPTRSRAREIVRGGKDSEKKIAKKPPARNSSSPTEVLLCIEEHNSASQDMDGIPPSLRSHIKPQSETVFIKLDAGVVFSQEQVLILQQQLRMHIQLATSNFLQLYVHPIHWRLGPTYKEYLETLDKLSQATENSVVNVCNLKPALELIKDWEEEVSKSTPDNIEMLEFINDQLERSRRRYAQNSLYVGEFHEKFKKLVANSSVFLYPYLLPAMPYKPEDSKRVYYLRSEDQLIVLGLDQFWRYIEDNKALFKPPRVSNSRHRWGLAKALQLVSKHMLPWITPKQLATHVTNLRGIRAYADKHNPIYDYFINNEVTPVEHSILPFYPELTLYDQPEHEMPRLWARYLAKSSKRFKTYISRRNHITGAKPAGIPVARVTTEIELKRPLPHDFTKTIKCTRNPNDPMTTTNPDATKDAPNNTDKPHEEVPLNMFRLVTTDKGSFLVPLEIVTIDNPNSEDGQNNIESERTSPEVKIKSIVDTESNTTPAVISKPSETPTKSVMRYNTVDHCSCCILLRKIAKKQTVITDYFGKDRSKKSDCYCSGIKYPKVTNKLRLLANNFKNNSGLVYNELKRRLEEVQSGAVGNETGRHGKYTLDELVSVTTFQLKLLSRSLMSKYSYLKVRCKNLLSRFNPDTGDPIRLANALFKTCGKEMLDLYFDFLEFLTTEQVDKINKFKDYFVRNCAKDLMDKVDTQVQSKESRARILSQLQRVFSDGKSTSCEICTYLLESMAGHQELAQYTFSLFPHRKEARISLFTVHEASSSSRNLPLAHITIKTQERASEADGEETQPALEYGAETSSGHRSGSEKITKENATAATPLEPPKKSEVNEIATEIKVEPDTTMDIEDNEIATTEPTHSFIITLQEIIKEEPLESDWKREEDKLILEVLKQQLTPEERKDKTIAEMLEEKNVFGIISESISHKSNEEVSDRVMYILSLLVQSES